MSRQQENAAAVAAALALRIEPLCRSVLPGGRRVGAEWTCGDLSGAPGRSLKVRLCGDKAGLWSDFAEGIAGDALDLVAAIRGKGKAEALRWARTWLGQKASPVEARSPMGASSIRGSLADRRLRAARRLWDEAEPTEGSLVEVYLAERGLTLDALPSDLRFAPACRHPGGSRWPAMIAAVRDPSGRFVGVHRTDLTPSGSDKAPIVPARAALGKMRGAGVHLGVIEDEAVVAEGIESALAGSLLTNGTPALGALGASGLRNLILPALPRAAHVLIFADGDRAGREATQSAKQRWCSEGRHVWTVRTPRACDANDLVRLPEYRARLAGDAAAHAESAFGG